MKQIIKRYVKDLIRNITIISISITVSILGLIAFASISWPINSPDWEPNGWKFQTYFLKIFQSCPNWQILKWYDINKNPICTNIFWNWINVTSSRSLSTTYTNNTGRPIMVSVSTYSWSPSTRCAVSISVNWIGWIGYNFVNNSVWNAMCNSSIIIPSWATYRAHNDWREDITLWSWYETN